MSDFLFLKEYFVEKVERLEKLFNSSNPQNHPLGGYVVYSRPSPYYYLYRISPFFERRLGGCWGQTYQYLQDLITCVIL